MTIAVVFRKTPSGFQEYYRGLYFRIPCCKGSIFKKKKLRDGPLESPSIKEIKCIWKSLPKTSAGDGSGLSAEKYVFILALKGESNFDTFDNTLNVLQNEEHIASLKRNFQISQEHLML